jgi:micrococcal nuclease
MFDFWRGEMNDRASSVASYGMRLAAYVAGFGLAAAAAATAIRASAGKPTAACNVARSAPVALAAIAGAGLVELADGRQILLSGIEAPRLSAKGKPAPYAMEARAAVEQMTKGRTLELGAASAPSKRGLIRAQLFTDGGKWVQGELISRGLARVRTFPDRRECAEALLALETNARQAKRGIWSSDVYAVRTPESAAEGVNTYQLVQGSVVEAANIRGRVFLNFGPDYKTDFTVHIGPDAAKLLAQAGLKPDQLTGKRILARGWVRERNGPVIDVTTPEQLQVLN